MRQGTGERRIAGFQGRPNIGAMRPRAPRVDDNRRTKAPVALDQLMPLVYEELKRIAHHQLRVNESRATLSTTELVHEAFLKLAGDAGADWDGRAHFFGAASRAMRQVLVDFARRRTAAKRGGGLERVSLGDGDAALEIELDEILALDEALDQLDAVDPRLRQVVELRFFAARSEAEIARMLGVSPRTVERDWLKARLVLLAALDRDRS
jgi:RNA polymerase sigma factor (TIGR02999 family)